MDYTRQAKEVLKIAEKSAKEMAHPYVGTEHLLLGLRKVYTGVSASVSGNIVKVSVTLNSTATAEKTLTSSPCGRSVPLFRPSLD